MKYKSLNLDDMRNDSDNKMIKIPMPHQIESFEAIDKNFSFPMNGYKAGLLVLPTGAGKTYTAVNWICQNVLSKNYKVVWLAQSSYLLEQAYQSFYENAINISPVRNTLNIRVVSSNPSHSKPFEIENTDDVLIITTQTAVANYKKDILDVKGKIVVSKFEKFIKNTSGNQLFIVLDEAHHAPAFRCRNLLLDIKEMVPNTYLLGLTATPTHGDKKISGWLFKIFEQGILYEAKLSNLIATNILARPNYIERSTGKEYEVDDRMYSRLVREHKDLPEEIVDKLASDSGRNDYIVEEYIKNKDKYGKTIIFADRWYQCEYIKSKLKERADIESETVYSRVIYGGDAIRERGSRSQEENKKIIDEFKDKKKGVLINVRMLTEGVDIPDVQTVFLTRQTTSSILMTQMIGRALRGERAGGGTGKSEANIVLFMDNWKRIINWVNPDGGEIAVDEPMVRGFYPHEYISIRLVEELVKDINGTRDFPALPYLSYIPIGWYIVEYTLSNNEEMNEEMQTFSEFIMVYESNEEKYKDFMKQNFSSIPIHFADEHIDDNELILWTKNSAHSTFDLEEDDIGGQLENSLVKITRHMAQNGIQPVYHSFDERHLYNLSRLVDLLKEKKSEYKHQYLQNEFYRSGNIWKYIYKSYIRFKTAYDAEENRILMGDEPFVIDNPDPDQDPNSNSSSINNGIISPSLREQVLRRDKYECLCCGKKRGKGIILELDHIIPYYSCGETDLNNLQTLCKECNNRKGRNGINFRDIHVSPLEKSKNLVLFARTSREKPQYTLIRSINFFYHCKALSELKYHIRSNGEYFQHWIIELYSGNDTKLLKNHKNELLEYIQKDLKCPNVKKITIKSD